MRPHRPGPEPENWIDPEYLKPFENVRSMTHVPVADPLICNLPWWSLTGNTTAGLP